MGDHTRDPGLGGSEAAGRVPTESCTPEEDDHQGDVESTGVQRKEDRPPTVSAATESSSDQEDSDSTKVGRDEKPVPKPRMMPVESKGTPKMVVDDLSNDLTKLSVQDKSKIIDDTNAPKTAMDDLSKDFGILSMHQVQESLPQEGERRKPTAQSIIAQIKELIAKKANRLRARGPGSLLKAHGPPGIPCFYQDARIQQDFMAGKRKGGPDTNPAKFFREKGPSEQDERTGNVNALFLGENTVQGQIMPCYDDNAGLGWPNGQDEFMNNLRDLAEDEIDFNMLINDICQVSPKDKEDVSQYLKLQTEGQKQPKQYVQPTEPNTRFRQPSINQQVPGSPAESVLSEHSNCSSGYKSGSPTRSYISDDFQYSPLSCGGGDVFSPAPSPYSSNSSQGINSPVGNDFVDGSQHTLDMTAGGCAEDYTDLAMDEIKRELEEQVAMLNDNTTMPNPLNGIHPNREGLEPQSTVSQILQQTEPRNMAPAMTMQPITQQQPQPQQIITPETQYTIIEKQMIHVNQPSILPAPMSQGQQQLPSQIQQPNQQIVTSPIGSPIQPQPMPQANCFPQQPSSSFAGQQLPGLGRRNCGCNHPNCEHTLILPRPSNPLPKSPYQPPIRLPSETRNGELGIKVDRDELLRARRWVASIKKEDLTKDDQDGDLALHIVVVQEDRCRLIALLERCKREGIIDQVINKQNIHTQTLLFLAVLADSITNASDMVAILLDFDADPLTSTISTGTNSHDHQFHFPIHMVAGKGNGSVPIMAKLLRRKKEEQLSKGCDSNQKALHYAALAHRERPSDQMICELLRQGADINSPEGKRGRTPLHYMVETRDVELVKTVLQILGRDKAKRAVNLQTYDHCTALHIAAGLHMDIACHKNLLRLLVYHGADLSAKNAQNQRAVDLLPAESREQLASILKGTNTSRYQTYTPVSPPSTATYIPPQSTPYLPMYVINTQSTATPLHTIGGHQNHNVTLVTGNQQLPCLAPSLAAHF